MENQFTRFTLEELLAMDYFDFFDDRNKLREYYQALDDSITTSSSRERKEKVRRRITEIRVHMRRRQRAVEAAERIVESNCRIC